VKGELSSSTERPINRIYRMGLAAVQNNWELHESSVRRGAGLMKLHR